MLIKLFKLTHWQNLYAGNEHISKPRENICQCDNRVTKNIVFNVPQGHNDITI